MNDTEGRVCASCGRPIRELADRPGVWTHTTYSPRHPAIPREVGSGRPPAEPRVEVERYLQENVPKASTLVELRDVLVQAIDILEDLRTGSRTAARPGTGNYRALIRNTRRSRTP